MSGTAAAADDDDDEMMMLLLYHPVAGWSLEWCGCTWLRSSFF